MAKAMGRIPHVVATRILTQRSILANAIRILTQRNILVNAIRIARNIHAIATRVSFPR